MKKRQLCFRIGSLMMAVLLMFTSMDLSVLGAETEDGQRAGFMEEEIEEIGEIEAIEETADEPAADEVISDEEPADEAETVEELLFDGVAADGTSGGDGQFSTGYMHYEGDDVVAVVGRDIGTARIFSAGAETLPATYKTENLPALRDQNPYGSCWAFTSLALAEISRMKAPVQEQDYSELALCYFSYNTVTDPLGGTAGDFNKCKGATFLDRGGNLNFSGPVLANWVGATDESIAPYTSAKTSLSKGLAESVAYNDRAHLTGYYKADIKNDRESVKKLIRDHGAVGVSIYAYTNPTNVAYNSKYNSYYVKNNYMSNHAVTIVGWDDTFPKENFNNVAAGDGAWLVRNSWWSSVVKTESYYGYFWLSYYDAGLSADAHAFEFAGADNYQNNYQYDGAMQSASISGFGVAEGANIFTAKACEKGEEIKAASFLTESSDVNYTVKVYTGLTEGNDPASGVLWDTVTGTTTYEGYYTVPLSQPVHVNAGDKFSIVVTLEKSNAYVKLGCEYNVSSSDWYQSNAAAEEGQSFVRSGSGWADYGKAYHSNLRIKAFTDNTDAGTPALPSLNISGIDEVLMGETAEYKALITPQSAGDGKNVVWTSSDPEIASMDETGKLTCHEAGVVTLTVQCGDMTATKAVSCYPHAPEVKYMMDTESNIALYWDPVPDADYYIVVKPDGSESAKIYAEGSGKVFFDDDSLKTNTDISMAVYKIYSYREHKTHVMGKHSEVTIYVGNSFNIVYEIGEGKNHPNNPDKYTLYDQITLRDATAPKGYSFGGWYLDSEYTNRITAIDGTAMQGFLRLYARYNPNTYYLRYNANYGGNIKAIYKNQLYYDTETKIYEIFELFDDKEGCTFVKWNTKKDGTGKDYYGGQVVTKLLDEDGGYFDLYAQWQSGGYTVTFDANGGICDVKSKAVSGGEKYGALPEPRREGYRFSGWFTEADGGSLVTADTKVSIMENHTLYAHWGEPGVFTVLFDACGGRVSPAAKTVKLGEAYGELPVPEKEGYIFEDWYLSQNFGKNERIKDTTPVALENDCVLYARYQECVGDVLFETELTDDGKIVSGTKLYLSTRMSGTRIYYTLDGSAPDTSLGEGYDQSAHATRIYDDAIVLSDADADEKKLITVTAAAVKRGCVNGPVTAVTYELVDESIEWGDISEKVAQEEEIVSAQDIPTGLWVSGVKDAVPYNGTAYTFPELSVYYGKLKLAYKKDYTVKYSKNKNAGKAAITISGKGNYSGKTEKTFDIKKLDISKASADDILLQYNGKAQKGKTTVCYDISGKTVTLKAGKDFDYVYPDASAVGDYTVILRGRGNYEGELAVRERITNSRVMSKLTYSIKGSAYQAGIPAEPSSLSVKDGGYELKLQKIGRDELTPELLTAMGDGGCDAVYYLENNEHAGDAAIVFVGTNRQSADGSKYEGTVKKTFKVTGIPISSARIEGLEKQYVLGDGPADPFHDGSVSLYAKTGEKLVIGTDGSSPDCQYMVRLVSGSMDAQGTAKVEIVGRNNYYGKITKTYKVLGRSISTFEMVPCIPQVLIYSGKEIKPVVNVVTPESKVLQIDEDYTLQYSNNINAGVLKIVAYGCGRYSGTRIEEIPIEPYVISTQDDNIVVEEIDEVPYTKNFTVPTVTIKRRHENGIYEVLKPGKDYRITCSNNTNVGDVAKATIEGIGNYAGTVPMEFEIVTGDFSRTEAASKDIVYQRKPGLYKKSSIALTDANGVKLKKDVDYTIDGYYYVNDTAGVEVKSDLGYTTDPARGRRGSLVEDTDILPAGTEIKAVLSSCSSDYDGVKEVVFRIVKADLSKAKVTVTPQTYTPGKKMEPTKGDIKIWFGKESPLARSDYEIVGYQDNLKKGNGKVILRGVGSYSGTKTVKFKIAAKSFTIFGLNFSL